MFHGCLYFLVRQTFSVLFKVSREGVFNSLILILLWNGFTRIFLTCRVLYIYNLGLKHISVSKDHESWLIYSNKVNCGSFKINYFTTRNTHEDLEVGMMIHIFNPSHSGDRARRILVSLKSVLSSYGVLGQPGSHSQNLPQ